MFIIYSPPFITITNITVSSHTQTYYYTHSNTNTTYVISEIRTISKEAVWCRHCEHQPRSKFILDSYQWYLICGVRDQHYVYDREMNAKKDHIRAMRYRGTNFITIICTSYRVRLTQYYCMCNEYWYVTVAWICAGLNHIIITCFCVGQSLSM